MKTGDNAFVCALGPLAARVEADAAAFIEEAETHYEEQIAVTAASIAAKTHGCQIVWMCGPSSVGKTTTAKRLCAELQTRGVQAFTVSLDDFYRGRGLAPQLPDGTFDYEAPEALDLGQLHTCVTELLAGGETMLPRYDFTVGRPSELKTLLHVTGDTVVFFEGVHAFTPQVSATAAGAATKPLRLFLNTQTRFTDGEDTLLSRRQVRLSRRLLRDERTRGSDFANTLTMWEQVSAGEQRYIFPYLQADDLRIDTTLWYEPCVLRELMTARLASLEGTVHEQTAAALAAAYARFPALDMDDVPAHSVLREFIGR